MSGSPPVSAVFVHGLLRPGHSLHHVVAPFMVGAERATVRGRRFDTGVPAARFNQDGAIDGWVLWLDRGRLGEALRILDDLEDEGERYRRVVVTARTGSGPVEAFAYEYVLR